jgi:hypothetical protein
MEDFQMNNNENVIEEVTVPKKKNNGKVILIVVAAFIVVGTAAYLTGKLMNSSGFNKQNGPIFFNEGGGGSSGTVIEGEINEEWPEEIPTTNEDLRGVFVGREDNLIQVGSGNVMVIGKSDNNGETSMDTNYDGPVADVLITPNTMVYRDITFEDLESGLPEEGETIIHKIEIGSIDDLGENSMLRVWGRKSGDRYIADVVLYSTPMMIANSVNK